MEAESSKKRKRLSLPRAAKIPIILSSEKKSRGKKVETIVLSSVKKHKSKAVEDDDDFATSVVPKVLPKKNNVGVSFRNPSDKMCMIVSTLNEQQKEALEGIGFGFVKDHVAKKFNKQICSFVLEQYDPKSNVLMVNNQKIHITRKGVHEMYGLPMGHKPMTVPVKSKFCLPVIKAWKHQFGKDVGRIRLSGLRKRIAEDSGCDSNFIINFLVAYVTIMIDGPGMGTCNQKFLENIKDDSKLEELDWCGFVIECLNQTTKYYKLFRPSQYTGPVAFLVLLYLHCTKPPSTTEETIFPATSFWNKEKSTSRLKEIMNDGGYEKVKVFESYESYVEDDMEHVPLSAVMKKFQKKKISKETVQIKPKMQPKKVSELKGKGNITDIPQEKETVEIKSKMQSKKDSNLKGKGKITDIPQEKDDAFFDQDWIEQGGYHPDFEEGPDSAKSLEDFKWKIDFLFKNLSDVKPTIDDWISRAWAQFPGNEDIAAYAKKRNDEFNSGCENLILKYFDLNTEVHNDANDEMDHDANPEGHHHANPEFHNDANPLVDYESSDQVGDEPKEGVDIGPSQMTQIFCNEELCSMLERQALEHAARTSSPLFHNDSTFGEQSGVKNSNVASEVHRSDPNVRLDEDFKTPKPVIAAIPINMSTEKVKETIFCPIPIQSMNAAVVPNRPKRVVKPGPALCSPYEKKHVDSGAVIEKREVLVASALFMGVRDVNEKVFESSEGLIGYRAVMESLIPGCRLHIGVIDLWSGLLNHYEKFKTFTTPSRFYMPCSLLNKVVFKKNDSVNGRFVEKVQSYLRMFPRAKNLRTTNLVFFPILRKQHYFLIVFDLKNQKMLLIDNDKNKRGMHIQFLESLKIMFSQYLTMINHPRAKGFESCKLERLELQWQTKSNNIDCGLFLMRHMEMYYGLENFDCDLEPDLDDQQQLQLNEMRQKYAAKILLSDLNLCKASFLESLEEYKKLTTRKKQKIYEQLHLKEIEDRVQKMGFP